MENVYKVSIGRRSRQSSESGYHEDGNGGTLMSPGFMFGATAASPPKFATLEEIMKAAKSLDDMALAHEIAVDDQFKLVEAEFTEEEADTMEQKLVARVHKQMHRAYWEILREQLSQDPPEFKQAIALISEIKDAFVKLGLAPKANGARAALEAKLDLELIQQQVDANTFVLRDYLTLIASAMAEFCSPARDNEIKEILDTLREKEGSTASNQTPQELVPVFRSIMETLSRMRLDFANVTIALMRPVVQAQSAEYERTKFLEFVETIPTALASTEIWIRRHVKTEKSEEEVMRSAFLELLWWNPFNPFPEPFAVDFSRIRSLAAQARQLVLTSACVLVSLSGPGAALQYLVEFRRNLRHKIQVLLEAAAEEGRGWGEDEGEVLAGVAETVVKELGQGRQEHGHALMTEEEKQGVRAQITSLAVVPAKDALHPEELPRIRQLVRERLAEFLSQILAAPSASTSAQVQLPIGLTCVSDGVIKLAGSFTRLIAHNRRVFWPLYRDIVGAERGKVEATATVEAASTNTPGLEPGKEPTGS